jgi:arylsulfatase
MTYTKAHFRMPESSIINLKNASYDIEAEIELSGQHSHGVIACQGGNMAGWSLYLDEAGKPSFAYNWFGHELTVIASQEALAEGAHKIKLHYEHDGGFGKGGLATLQVDGLTAEEGRIEQTVPVVFSMSGETFDVGRDTGSAVGPYPHDFEFRDKIMGVTLERLSNKDKKTQAAETRGKFKAGLSTQ